MNLNKRISSSRHCAITSHCLVPGETKHFKYIFLYLTIINACNIPQFLECKMQILFITVCDTSGTWIRKQLFYFISVITFQQISFTFQFGRENLDFLSISSPLTVSQQWALLVHSPSTAISYTKLHILTFITSEHVKLLVFTPICSQRLCRRQSREMLADCHYLRLVPLSSSVAAWMRVADFCRLLSLLLTCVLFTVGLLLCHWVCFAAEESTLSSTWAGAGISNSLRWELCKLHEWLCTNKAWKAWITLEPTKIFKLKSHI